MKRNFNTTKPHKNTKSSLRYLIFIIVLITSISIGGYVILHQTGLIKTFQLAMQIQNQQQTSPLQPQDEAILEKLNKIINLPKNITPTMAIITDADKLKQEQPAFFADSKNGNRLIIYPDRAIIYDYTENKIINIGPVNYKNKS